MYISRWMIKLNYSTNHLRTSLDRLNWWWPPWRPWSSKSWIGRCALPRSCWRVAWKGRGRNTWGKICCTTPRKINMEPKNDGLVQMIFPSLKRGDLVISMLNLPGCIFLEEDWKIGSIERRDWEGQGLVVVEHGCVTGHYITPFWGIKLDANLW